MSEKLLKKCFDCDIEFLTKNEKCSDCGNKIFSQEDINKIVPIFDTIQFIENELNLEPINPKIILERLKNINYDDINKKIKINK
jgi:hypothetical protein